MNICEVMGEQIKVFWEFKVSGISMIYYHCCEHISIQTLHKACYLPVQLLRQV